MDAKLQVMICTYGPDGIRRVASSLHPEVEGVEYLVSWQTGGASEIPDELLREDFRILMTPSKGLSVNRNHAIDHATAPLLLVSDDDVDYTEMWLRRVMDAFAEYPEYDVLAFEYISENFPKKYPRVGFGLDSPAKGYYVTSFEMAFRREKVQSKVRFNESFGIGAMFPSGEEDVFLKDCRLAGLKCRFIPEVIARHDGSTTSSRDRMSVSMPQTKGAAFLHMFPASWPLRMCSHVLRQFGHWRKGNGMSPVSYALNWLKGVAKAKRHGVFSDHRKQPTILPTHGKD